MKKKLLIITLLSVICALIIIMSCGTIIITTSTPNHPKGFKNDSVIQPFSFIDTTDLNNYNIYIKLGKYDKEELNISDMYGNCFVSNNQKTIKKFSKLVFSKTQGDMATVDNAIYITYQDKLVYQSGFIIEQEYIGLQNKEIGWIEHKTFFSSHEFKTEFRAIKYPIIFL